MIYEQLLETLTAMQAPLPRSLKINHDVTTAHLVYISVALLILRSTARKIVWQAVSKPYEMNDYCQTGEGRGRMG